ncbi:hypothetical protein DQ04_01311100 [Trypanosoma grayi]|uniref:hypothetical protein n=1 Tax=Trypanosoma grayi TaxID=71804 RepID=UPI0004F41583|nr:hypothetical protein DQ04_01311100 [Trypanosoma grayi]KEG12951.1 hypothetical protein DQ04_01311100 [Trypanosoma grayi]
MDLTPVLLLEFFVRSFVELWTSAVWVCGGGTIWVVQRSCSRRSDLTCWRNGRRVDALTRAHTGGAVEMELGDVNLQMLLFLARHVVAWVGHDGSKPVHPFSSYCD